MNSVARKTEQNWVEYPSMYIRLLKELADRLRDDKKLNKVAAVNTLEGAVQEITALQEHRKSLMQTSETGSDADLLLKAFMKGVARWEIFKGYPALSNEGEVCVGGLRYATQLKDGIPVLHEVLRNALKRVLGYKV